MKHKLRIYTAILGMALAIGLTGCNSQDAGNIAKDAGKIAKDVGQASGNAQLAGRVNTTLIQRKGVHFEGLRVEAKEGVVTISGHVNDANEKRIVKETAEGIRGVEKVDVSKLNTQK